MHMADALISPAVGGTLWAVSGGLIAFCAPWWIRYGAPLNNALAHRSSALPGQAVGLMGRLLPSSEAEHVLWMFSRPAVQTMPCRPHNARTRSKGLRNVAP